MPAAICTLVVSWVLEDNDAERREERKTHRYRAACAVPENAIAIAIYRQRRNVRDASASRATQITM